MDAVRGVTGANGLLSMSMATSALNQMNGFVDHGMVSDGDANDLVQGGFWSTHGALKNLPQQGPWGMLTVYAPMKGQDYIKQEWTSVNDNATFVRMRESESLVWKPWTKLGG